MPTSSARSVAEDPVNGLIAGVFDLYSESFRSGEVDSAELARLFHPEGTHVTRFAALEGRVYEGHDGIACFVAESREQFERFDVSLERVVGEGDHRVAVYTVDALTRETRVPIAQRLGMEIELRDDRIYRTRVHADPQDALAAVGLDGASG